MSSCTSSLVSSLTLARVRVLSVTVSIAISLKCDRGNWLDIFEILEIWCHRSLSVEVAVVVASQAVSLLARTLSRPRAPKLKTRRQLQPSAFLDVNIPQTWKPSSHVKLNDYSKSLRQARVYKCWHCPGSVAAYVDKEAAIKFKRRQPRFM